ncbi:MAG TPA: bifunctional [glutamate--ammonia ligase]-adenylyl-L-tyrosine phosphorylase/[glutamate--ammonia-ligase] adenylyltransferase, partial [Myxococcaceae bacterium]|nr:bifunctional [glutamate--ammonia ligase]-adenylyl-L-tyrosine phosphorylase/[glutamate--ammonia-ligase] adenylyltransferase [Myxococcaceae bacterium]
MSLRLLLEKAPRSEQVFAALEALGGAEISSDFCARALMAAEPDLFVSSLDRLLPALRRARAPGALSPLASVMSASAFLPRHLARRPGLLRWIAEGPACAVEKLFSTYARDTLRMAGHAPSSDPEAFSRRIRRYKYRELLRIALRDAYLEVSPEATGRETTALAEAIIRGALVHVSRGLVERYGLPSSPAQPTGAWAPIPDFCVLGLGKLGGGDLNFSSDIDLIYLYRDAGETTGGGRGALNHVQYFSRLAEGLTRTLSAMDPEGFCYRVDLNLRPHGRSGPIVLSLAQMLAYYETLGRTWERAALLKARVVAGDAALGRDLLDGLAPFVWRRSLDFSALAELKQLKAQIDLRGKSSEDDVKLGPGGIREVEFFANALQLLYGGRDPSLRERHTLRALRKLASHGRISAADRDALEEAYLFLRRLENRLQMVEERQTHDLPGPGRERDALAYALGFAHGDGLMRELRRHRQTVKAAFHTLLGRVATDALPDEPLLALALDGEVDPVRRREALTARGFESPERALALFDLWANLPDAPFDSAGAGPTARSLHWLSDIVRTADPDQALEHFTEFLTATSAPRGALDLLSRTPNAARRLLNLFGQTDYLSRYFLRHPELFDGLLEGQWDEANKTPARLKEELNLRAQRTPEPEQSLGAMRRFKNEELLRIGMNDIDGTLDVPEVALQLTAIAEGVLDQALFLADREQRERYGPPLAQGRPTTLALLGMGKLGGAEMGYHSDLDLIFVYQGDGLEETAGGSKGRVSLREYFAKVAQRLLSFLQLQFREGSLYRVDTRLRPSGNKGTLVVSWDAFHDHHSRRAQLWERQALIKARPVAGDAQLGERLRRQVIEPLTFERPLPEGAAAEIDRLRTRMEREIAHETAEQANPKTGHGGLVDVEFCVQYLQLRHGAAGASLRSPHTLRALEALTTGGYLAADDGETLRAGYLFHRRLENRLRLVHGHSLSLMPTSGKPLARLARR